MKKILVLSCFCALLSTTTFAQSNDVVAKLEFRLAEEEFAAKNYESALRHLVKSKDLLGGTNPKISYLLFSIMKVGLETVPQATDKTETMKYMEFSRMLGIAQTYLNSYGNEADERVTEIYRYKEEYILPGLKAYENKVLPAHLKKKGLKAVETNNGVFIIVSKKGSGKAIKEGDKVLVKYTVRKLDGTAFDSNVDPKFGDQPCSFTLGKGEVIKGWEDAARMMNNGDAATIYIPPSMGYGTKRNGTIPPNTFLAFDMEIVSVE